MAKKNDRSTISVGQWMLIMFLTALPCVGLPFVLFGSFFGENDTRKNYCRAILLWYVVAAVLWLVLVVAGIAPQLHAKWGSLWK